MELIERLRQIPKSEKPIILQPTRDDPDTEDNEAKDIANGEHDGVRGEWARICGTVAFSDWEITKSYGEKRLNLVFAVAEMHDATLAVSWDPGRGANKWDTWRQQHDDAVYNVRTQCSRLRAISQGAGTVGYSIINHEHGNIGGEIDAEVVTRFLLACVGAIRAAFPLSTVMVYDEGMRLGKCWTDSESAPYLPPGERFGGVRCISRYPGEFQQFQGLCERAQVDFADNRPLIPHLWMSHFNYFAEAHTDKWWHGRERIAWDEPHLKRYMSLVGKYIRQQEEIAACVIHSPKILDPMHVEGLAALVGADG